MATKKNETTKQPQIIPLQAKMVVQPDGREVCVLDSSPKSEASPSSSPGITSTPPHTTTSNVVPAAPFIRRTRSRRISADSMKGVKRQLNLNNC
jgi:hypothetical protein